MLNCLPQSLVYFGSQLCLAWQVDLRLYVGISTRAAGTLQYGAVKAAEMLDSQWDAQLFSPSGSRLIKHFTRHIAE